MPRTCSDFARHAHSAIETDPGVTHGRVLDVMLQAVTHVSTTYPGFLRSRPEMMPEFRSMLLDRHRTGTVAQSLGAMSMAAQGVRDQLSDDVWMVLADIERRASRACCQSGTIRASS